MLGLSPVRVIPVIFVNASILTLFRWEDTWLSDTFPVGPRVVVPCSRGFLDNDTVGLPRSPIRASSGLPLSAVVQIIYLVLRAATPSLTIPSSDV